eukprot:259423-Prymnesium_polylepis.1
MPPFGFDSIPRGPGRHPKPRGLLSVQLPWLGRYLDFMSASVTVFASPRPSLRLLPARGTGNETKLERSLEKTHTMTARWRHAPVDGVAGSSRCASVRNSPPPPPPPPPPPLPPLRSRSSVCRGWRRVRAWAGQARSAICVSRASERGRASVRARASERGRASVRGRLACRRCSIPCMPSSGCSRTAHTLRPSARSQ